MSSPFTLRAKVDTDESDNWIYALKSNPTKDYWEHIFAADDDIYLYNTLNKNTIGTVAAVIDADVPSISSADGKLTNITCYSRGKATPEGIRTFELHATVGDYASHLHFDGDGTYYTHSYVCTQHTDLEDDLWDLVMGGEVWGVDMTANRWLDYIYCVVNYTPAAPTCFQQSIVASDDGKTLTVSATRYQYYTWLKARGYEVRNKETEEVIYTDEVEGDRDFRKMAWFEGARETEREIDLAGYVGCGTTYEARSWGETDDGKGYGAWVEFSTLPCAGNYPLMPVLFPARIKRKKEVLKPKCILFEKSMEDACLTLNYNVNVTRRYLQETYGGTTYAESSNLRYVFPSQQLIKLLGKDPDYNAIIRNFISNISDIFILINENNTLMKQWLDDYEPDEVGHEFTDVKMPPIVVGEDLNKAMDDLFAGIEDNVIILNTNTEMLIERF